MVVCLGQLLNLSYPLFHYCENRVMGHVSLGFFFFFYEDWMKQLTTCGSSHAKQASAQFTVQFFNRLQRWPVYSEQSDLVLATQVTWYPQKFHVEREIAIERKMVWEYEELDAVLIYESYVYSTWIQRGFPAPYWPQWSQLPQLLPFSLSSLCAWGLLTCHILCPDSNLKPFLPGQHPVLYLPQQPLF